MVDVAVTEHPDCYDEQQPSGSSFAGDVDEPPVLAPGGSSRYKVKRKMRPQTGVESLARLIRAPMTDDEIAWRTLARCRGADNDEFFPSRGKSGDPAKGICRGCVVMEECLEWALAARVPGVWGGTNEQQRDEIRRGRVGGAPALGQLAFAL